jgi:hydrogenase nickel incorporation protein HypA/HybF
MHELGIVFHMTDMLEELGADNDLSHIGVVHLRLGEVSGVIDSYLQDCWGWATNKSDLLRGCELAIETVNAVTHCEGCGSAYPTLEHGKICPQCGSAHTYLIQGNEVEIDSIEGY